MAGAQRHGLVWYLIAAAILLEVAGVVAGRMGSDHTMLASLLICVATMALLAARLIPEYLTALLFFVACALGAFAPATVFLAGFASSAVWLVVSGAIIGAALRHTGLADRLGAMLAPSGEMAFTRFLWRVMLFGAFLMFFMPSSMGRILLMIPLLQATVKQIGLEPAGRRASAVMLAGIFGTFIPATSILPASVPNNVLAGLMDSTGIGAPSFSEYMLLHFPVLGMVSLALIACLLAFLYRGEATVSIAGDVEARAPMSPAEKRLAFVLFMTILLWATDAIHGLPTAWVGMLAAVTCLWPGNGLMPQQALRAVGLEPVFYVAGVVGVGTLIQYSGLGSELAGIMSGVAGFAMGSPWESVLLLSGAAALLALLVTVVAVPAVLTPIAENLSQSTGLTVEAVAMSQVMGFSTVFFPYQAPPFAVAIQSGAVSPRDMTKFCFLLACAMVVVVWPLNLVWWGVLGWFG
ncbi:MAG: anion permease [Rhodobiaceae bacterium]|nr:anion permease [Rhodobiaceae bacterium]MCC0048093.1 anion permease [Rhodobiaceae bacterium]